MADEAGIPYQTLINLYLRDCTRSGRRLTLAWDPDDCSGSTARPSLAMPSLALGMAWSVRS